MPNFPFDPRIMGGGMPNPGMPQPGMGGQNPMLGRMGGMPQPIDPSRGPRIGSFKRGGKVKKTAIYKLDRGERVLTKKQAKLWDML